jgi:hypothetical protein
MAGTHVFDLPHRSTLFRVSSHSIAFNGSDCNLMVLSSYLRDQMDQRDFVQQALTFHGSINSNQIHLLISSFPKKDLRHCQSSPQPVGSSKPPLHSSFPPFSPL